jgi:hemerythrin HHE cation binding domain-containing protein
MISEILEHDHAQLAQLLQALTTGLHQHDARQTFAVLDLFWARLAVHIRAENLFLFPAILNAPRESFGKGGMPSFEEAKVIVDDLRSDHSFFMDELASAVKTFREILVKDEGAPHLMQIKKVQECVDAVVVRLDSHNALEEDRVYQWPALVLSASELEALRSAVDRELENLPPRFAAL